MASLYEIDAAIMALVDPDTGEISDWAEFDALQMERERKIENVACWYKNLIAEAKMLKDEENALKARREAVERSAEKRLEYLQNALNGENFRTAKCAVTFRKTPAAVQIQDEAIAIEWAKTNYTYNCVKYVQPTLIRTELAKVLKSGVEVPGVQLVQGISIGVK